MIKQLKIPLICYLTSGLLLVVVIIFNIAMQNYNSSLQETLSKFPRIKANLIRMETASADTDLLLAHIKSFIPLDFKESTPEKKIFIALDAMTSRLRNSEISIKNIHEEGDVISLPVVINGILITYPDFVNTLGYMMSLKFPFYEIGVIDLTRKEIKDGHKITYQIEGKLRMPKS